MITLTQDERFGIEKLLDIQRGQLIQLADKIANTLIISEAKTGKEDERMNTLRESFKKVSDSIEKNMITTKKFEEERMQEGGQK